MTFTHRNAVNLYFVYELNTWSKDLNMDFTLGDCQFGALKLTQNVNPNKFNDLMHVHNFHCRLVNGVQMLLYLVWKIVHQDIPVTEKKDILVLGEGPIDGLDDITITIEAKYSVLIIKLRKKIYFYKAMRCMNDVKIYQFQAKDSEIKPYILCLENISKVLIVGSMKKKLD